MKIKSFPPVLSVWPRTLILGSAPGIESLAHNQYYAHPRNAFWPILFDSLGRPFSAEFKDKLELIFNNNLALWDVLKTCSREGSLDSNITHMRPNNVNALIDMHTKLRAVLFNGKAAEKFYYKFFKPVEGVTYISLPSTSPANASVTYANKLILWRAALKNFAR